MKINTCYKADELRQSVLRNKETIGILKVKVWFELFLNLP